MRVAVIIAALWLGLPSFVRAEGTVSPPPADLGVHVQKAAGDGVHFAHGQGIYLGGGLILTAAHVVNYDPDHPAVTIRLDGVLLQGDIVFDSLLKDTDLALVKIAPNALSDKRRSQAYISVCSENASPRQPVLVVEDTDTKPSVTLDAPLRTIGNDGTNILMLPVRPGNSGAGVFDRRSGCLLGVVLQEAGGTLGGRHLDDVAIFAPSSNIAPFVADFLKRQPLIDGKTP